MSAAVVCAHVKAAKSSLKAHLGEASFKTHQLRAPRTPCHSAEPTCTRGHKVDP